MSQKQTKKWTEKASRGANTVHLKNDQLVHCVSAAAAVKQKKK